MNIKPIVYYFQLDDAKLLEPAAGLQKHSTQHSLFTKLKKLTTTKFRNKVHKAFSPIYTKMAILVKNL